MNVLLILILVSLTVATVFLAAFIWAVRAGQFDDTCTPAFRMLNDDGTGGPPGGEASAESTQPQKQPNER